MGVPIGTRGRVSHLAVFAEGVPRVGVGVEASVDERLVPVDGEEVIDQPRSVEGDNDVARRLGHDVVFGDPPEGPVVRVFQQVGEPQLPLLQCDVPGRGGERR